MISIEALYAALPDKMKDKAELDAVLRHIFERYDRPRLTIAAGPLAAPLFACVPGLERLITVTKFARNAAVDANAFVFKVPAGVKVFDGPAS